MCGQELTVVASRNTAAGLAVRRLAGVLLEVGLGNATVPTGHRPVLVLASHDGGVLGQGRGEGGEAEDDGGKGQVHVGGVL